MRRKFSERSIYQSITLSLRMHVPRFRRLNQENARPEAKLQILAKALGSTLNALKNNLTLAPPSNRSHNKEKLESHSPMCLHMTRAD